MLRFGFLFGLTLNQTHDRACPWPIGFVTEDNATDPYFPLSYTHTHTQKRLHDTISILSGNLQRVISIEKDAKEAGKDHLAMELVIDENQMLTIWQFRESHQCMPEMTTQGYD